jgi:uncharacterized BrkB/YihY/UPF0761 family membrane protein
MRQRIAQWRQRVEDMRPRSRIVETGFRMLERDSRIAGGVLGGGLAYRLFFWSLGLAVLAFGALGFAPPDQVDSAAQGASLGASVASVMSTAAEQAQAGRWWLLLMGIVLVMWFAWMLLRALRLVTASAWRVRSAGRLPRPANVLTIISVPLVFILVSALTGWIANVLGPLSGAAAALVGVALFTGLIVLGFAWLPSKPVPLRAHLPGAIVLAVGMQLLGMVGEFFLAEQLASAEQLYGVLGLAATLLFVLYLIGRITVWSCELNAVAWEVWHDDGAPEGTGDRATG